MDCFFWKRKPTQRAEGRAPNLQDSFPGEGLSPRPGTGNACPLAFRPAVDQRCRLRVLGLLLGPYGSSPSSARFTTAFGCEARALVSGSWLLLGEGAVRRRCAQETTPGDHPSLELVAGMAPWTLSPMP